MPQYAFLDPEVIYALPDDFDYRDYIDTEREFWALFPETAGMRVNFLQLGLTAQLYVETYEDGSELRPEETYFIMPCSDCTMRPLRMRALRRLTLAEFRMSQLTAMKLMGRMQSTAGIMHSIDETVLGPELLRELRES